MNNKKLKNEISKDLFYTEKIIQTNKDYLSQKGVSDLIAHYVTGENHKTEFFKTVLQKYLKIIEEEQENL